MKKIENPSKYTEASEEEAVSKATKEANDEMENEHEMDEAKDSMYLLHMAKRMGAHPNLISKLEEHCSSCGSPKNLKELREKAGKVEE